MSNEKIIAKLKKLLNLAQQGVGGERTNAKSILDKLLKKHGLTLEDLDDEHTTKEKYAFSYKNDLERRMLRNLIATILDVPQLELWTGRKSEKKFYVEMTAAQKVEIDMAYSIYRKALAKSLEQCMLAFLHTNGLFPKSHNTQRDDKHEDVDMEEIMAITAMAEGMKKTAVHKALPNTGRT